MRRVLITRPIDDAVPLTASLKARSVEALVEPMMTIRSTEEPLPDLDGVQGLLFTSANGVRGFLTRTDRRDFTAYAVGEATGEAARRAGFTKVEVAGGDVVTLAALVIAQCKPDAGKLIHVAGTHVAGNLSEQLTTAGFVVERAVLYDALSAHSFYPATIQALKRGEVEAVMLFSPRTAEIFMTLIDDSGAEQSLSAMAAICLSQAVADRLPEARFRTIIVAAKPDQNAMLDALDRALPSEKLISLGLTTPAQKAERAPSRGVGFAALVFMGLLSVVSSLALLALTVETWRPMFLPTQENEASAAIAALNRRVAALETARAGASVPAVSAAPASVATAPVVPAELLERIARLEQRPTAVPAITAPVVASAPERVIDLGPLENRIAALEARPMASPFDPTPVLDQVARIADRIGRTEQKANEGEGRFAASEALAAKRVALALGLAQISDLASVGLPFPAQLAQLAQVGEAGVTATVQRLEGVAKRGAPTLEQLRQRFPDAARRALNASFAIESGDLVGELRAALNRAITIRRVDALTVEGTDPESQLARAEALLARGDLTGALQQLEGLPAQAQGVIGDWVAAAKDRLALEASMRELSAAILRLRTGS
jgi:uroporphyrinogen-III synthase